METMEHRWRAKISSYTCHHQLDSDDKHILNGLFDMECVAQMKSNRLIPRLCQEAYCAGPPRIITTTISEKKQACMHALKSANKSATRDARTIYSGKALEMVSRVPYDGCPFPLGRRVAFIFVNDTKGGTDEDIGSDEDIGTDKDIVIAPLAAEGNIDTFVERIKQMAPLVSEICTSHELDGDMPRIANQYFDNLASRLYQLAYRVEYNYVYDTADPIRPQLDVICNLSHVNYTSASDVDNAYQFIQLARKNALTLQSLVLECRHDIDILGLVQDVSGNHIAYPRLMSLKPCTETDSDEPTRSVFHGAAPFPALRRLHINLDFSFDDDTFFRDNGATLEQLDMQMDSLDASVLRKYKVFVPGSHLRLQSVKIWHTGDFELESFTSPADVMQFMCTIGSGEAVQEYAFSRHIQDQANLLSPLGSHACIQVLSLPNLHPALWDVIGLIKSPPLLSDLHTSLPSLGPMPDGVTMDTLPEHIVSNYAPMGRRFRCWHLHKGYIRNFSELAKCVLLLALVYPNFDYAVPPSFQRELFMKQMEKDIFLDRFKSYAPRLRRLLFHRWKDC
ncbi:hypothetical protein GGI19_000078 [Coemansia pectinata]|uniref:Uncharacterized protein n=1 Tax=Coemansia pectinata TaxID=1052879 RepID=A0A9W8H1I5_9FUNG|nr:hypothetical protein GGI19_000078 [Coemansia pectinata]